MSLYADFFTGKRVTILGLGLLGRGVGDAEFIAQHAARVTVTDTKNEEQLKESIERLKGYSNITLHLGGHKTQDVTDADMVIKAAGVRLDSPEVAAARKAGMPVYMSTALAAKFSSETGATVVGITGTRGKSTVAYMVQHALAAAGKRSHLGGNIRGLSTLAMVPAIQADDVLVLELDSWQLQGFGDLKRSPQIAAFMNLMPDHLNYYPDMETYFADKANIFRFQKEGDALFVGEGIVEKVKAARPAAMLVVPPAIPPEWKLQVPGEHNRSNASFAVAILRELGLSESEIKAGIESFAGVEGRLQFVRELNGVRVYNDNNATTPEATIAALESFEPDKTVLIFGGADKGLVLDRLLEKAKTCKRVILVAGSGTERIRDQFEVEVYDALKPAVQAALSGAAAGDVVLFSPGFASFGMFQNEYDRNDQFLHLINSL